MRNTLAHQTAIARYLLDNPCASPTEISGALNMTNRVTRYVVNLMVEGNKVIRTKKSSDKRSYALTLSEWYTDELINGPAQPKMTPPQRLEKTATQLEHSGFWRRAATVWAELLVFQKTATGMGKIARRRNHCLRIAKLNIANRSPASESRAIV